MRICT